MIALGMDALVAPLAVPRLVVHFPPAKGLDSAESNPERERERERETGVARPGLGALERALDSPPDETVYVGSLQNTLLSSSETVETLETSRYAQVWTPTWRMILHETLDSPTSDATASIRHFPFFLRPISSLEFPCSLRFGPALSRALWKKKPQKPRSVRSSSLDIVLLSLSKFKSQAQIESVGLWESQKSWEVPSCTCPPHERIWDSFCWIWDHRELFRHTIHRPQFGDV